MNTFVNELRPFEDAGRQLEGWEFEFEPEVIEGEVPWCYEMIASEVAASSASST